MKYFDDFDIAISDLEPLLPRIADVRRKPFLALDNQHAMLFCKINTKEFTLKEKNELLDKVNEWIQNVIKETEDFIKKK